ncbi:hypothetical protein [Maritalea porphyrae]|uniref:helix-turn-helix transcriptional regulator n=1 Tax=Maritalea porphyrae TaxID=880732 RepID=UPI0022AFDCF7|nr:hypothetical protein [Maritalea porphyrae]MCZ4271859.1 hypothetical protein [Maritalea porphyrae]
MAPRFSIEATNNFEQNASPPLALEKGGFFVIDFDHQTPLALTPVPDWLIAATFTMEFDATLTNSELQLLKQLLCSKSLREISAEDGVSYETRRNQLKKVLEKSNLNRQVTLLLVMSNLLVKALFFEHKTCSPSCTHARD